MLIDPADTQPQPQTRSVELSKQKSFIVYQWHWKKKDAANKGKAIRRTYDSAVTPHELAVYRNFPVVHNERSLPFFSTLEKACVIAVSSPHHQQNQYKSCLIKPNCILRYQFSQAYDLHNIHRQASIWKYKSEILEKAHYLVAAPLESSSGKKNNHHVSVKHQRKTRHVSQVYLKNK